MGIIDWSSGKTVLIALPMLFWGILAVSMIVDMRRMHNCFLLLVALAATVPFLCSLTGDRAINTFALFVLATVVLLLMLPFLLIANGFVVLRREGFSLSNMLSLLFGLLIFVGEMASFATIYLLKGSLYFWFASIALAFVVSVIYLCVVFLSFMLYTLFIQVIPKKRDFDYVIIHGAGLLHGEELTPLLRMRVDKAIEVYRKDPTPPVLVPSGGQGDDELISEAEAMARYLRAKGIPEDKILLEDRSTSTMENLKYSQELIESRPGRHYTALVTNNYHVFRALRYTLQLGFPCTGIGSPTALYYWPSALIREFAAIMHEKRNLRLFLIGWGITMLPFLAFLLFIFPYALM